VVGGRPHAVEPAAPVVVARRGERAARQLLGVEAEGRALRAVSADGQRAIDRLGFEVTAEARQVAHRVRFHAAPL